jgi:hypothetical protein
MQEKSLERRQKILATRDISDLLENNFDRNFDKNLLCLDRRRGENRPLFFGPELLAEKGN